MTVFEGLPDIGTARERTEKALRAQIGLMSPFWVAYGAAASAGLAWWLMTRLVAPVNLEALLAQRSKLDIDVSTLPSAIAAPAVVASASAEVDAPAAVQTIAPDEAAVAEVVSEADAELEVQKVDDLTQLVGVGPKIAKAMDAHGVSSFAQLAAWNDDDLARFDAAHDLKGKAIRADLLTQARRLAASAN